MKNTLFGRLLIASSIVLTLFLGSLGYITKQLFLENLIGNKQEQLKLQNYVLLSSAQFGDHGIVIDEELREPRFEDFESGLYGFITNQRGEILWQSYSAHSIKFDKALFAANKPQSGEFDFIVGPHYYRYHHTVSWEIVDNEPELITFTVLEDNRPALENAQQFEHQVQLWLVIIGLSLIIILLWVLRWGTKPLRKLASQLKQVESGESNRLQGKIPQELRGLTNNLNELLATEQRQRKRYHATLADLAHSLKTPLAVIRAELESNDKPSNTVISEQVARMDEIITHQLQRAVVTAPHKLGDTISIRETAERLTNALTKVYPDKTITFELDLDSTPQFKGDQRDLTEVLGNLLDNACKHCNHHVKVSASIDVQTVRIYVHDDGKGIDDAYKQQLIQRGLRADTRHAGQGIGLDIARDIISSYQGELTIADSPLGGAVFQISIPLEYSTP